MIKQVATHICNSIAAKLAATPVEVLEQAKRRQVIAAHNAEVNAKKRTKNHARKTLY